MRKLRVLISHEFSGVIRRAFRDRGHEAYSCDLLPSLDNSEFHLQKDFRTVLHYAWDLAIFHPVCTYICSSGISWNNYKPERAEQTELAINDFMECWNHNIYRCAIENPVGIMSSRFRKPDQKIQPWQFGHMENKETCLWLRGLPTLKTTNNVYNEMMQLPVNIKNRVHYEAPGLKNGLTRAQRRSITFKGIADAMAEQWGNIDLNARYGEY